MLESHFRAYFPQVTVQRVEDSLTDIYSDYIYAYTADYGLSEEFMRPINREIRAESDPFTSITGLLDELVVGERALIQVIFKGCVNAWAESINSSVCSFDGKSFFVDDQEMPALAKQKNSSPFCAVSLRVLTQAETDERAIYLVNRLNAIVTRVSSSPWNKIVPLVQEEYTLDLRLQDIVNRTTRRLGMLLNAEELLNFVHLPFAQVTSPKFYQAGRKTKTLPAIATNQSFDLGINEHNGAILLASIAPAQRLKHMHIIGATGTGKSTLLLQSIIQDIELGNGCAVLDPHGDLIENILNHIPISRKEDIIIFDPSDSEYPLGFNILSAHTDIEKDILSSDLVAVFKRLSTSWGDQMNSVLGNAIIAILESTQGGTLVDLRRFLIEKSFRESYLKTVKDENTVYYWQREFPHLKSSSIGPILTRLDTFLRPKLIRNMVAQKKSMDFQGIMDSGKVLLVKLAQGLIGAENSTLLGSFVVSKIQQVAMARQAQAKASRSDFFLYIDEFQNFITPSMSTILSGTRKYNLGLILAHQDMNQLSRYDSELASSVIANAGTRICFRLGDQDAKRLESGFSSFDARDFQNLNTGEAICRIERPDFDFSLGTLPMSEPTISYSIEIIEWSRKQYGTPKEEVEVVFQNPVTSAEPVMEIPTEEILAPKPENKRPSIKRIQPVEPLAETDAQKTIQQLEQTEELKQHRYLQTYIKRMAEARGYVATIEQPVPGGNGRVDVSLEKNAKRIAVEICVTTHKDWEVHNIKKCLEAGYEIVVECSRNGKALENIKSIIDRELNEVNREKVLLLQPDALIQHLDSEAAKEASTETRIMGYRVKVNYTPEANASDKVRESVKKKITDSLRKNNKG